MKRDREAEEDHDDGGDIKRSREEPAAAQQEPVEVQAAGDDEEDDQPLYSSYRMSSAVRRGAECPYLDTISRQVSEHRCQAPSPGNRCGVQECITVGSKAQPAAASQQKGPAGGRVARAAASCWHTCQCPPGSPAALLRLRRTWTLTLRSAVR